VSNKSSQAITPLEQAVIPFHNGEILGVRLPDNLIAAVLSSLCALLGITLHGQTQRIRRDEKLSKHLLVAVIQTTGGPQRAYVLAVGAIPSWLMGINLSLIAPEKRPLALALQFEAADALYRHFFQASTAQQAAKQIPEPDAAPKEWVEAEPFSPLPDDIWERQYQAMAGFEKEWRAVKADIASLNAHLAQVSADLAEVKVDLAALKAAQEQKPAGAARRADDRLSPDHFLHLYVLARSLESRTGEPLGAVMRELAAAFQVTDVGELPDSAWDGVLAWFWQRSQR
jgi:hypothetical protein